MRVAMHHGKPGRRCLGTIMAFLMVSLIPIPGSAGSPSSQEEEARRRNEWDKVRENHERTIRRNEKRIADISTKEGGVSSDEETRAARITQERVAGIKASLKDGGRGKSLAQTAEKAGSEAGTLVELYKAQDEYLRIVTSEWAEGADRKYLQEANTALQKNIEVINSHLAQVIEAAQATSTRIRQSGVLEKAVQSEAAAREAGERLSARWERDRAALAREREQREREAGERARERRL